MRFTCVVPPCAMRMSIRLLRFRLLTILSILHTIDEYRRFIANVISKECEVTVAEDESGIVGFLALKREETRLLFTRPDRIAMGAGRAANRSGKGHRCGVCRLMSVPDAFTKHEAFTRSVYRCRGQREADARHPVSVGASGSR